MSLIRVVEDPAYVSLQCFHDNPEGQRGVLVCLLDETISWEDIQGSVVVHQATHKCGKKKPDTLAGHTLMYEGMPFDAEGEHLVHNSWKGPGKCSCGELSESLPSNRQRKAWHRDHKQAVRSARGDGGNTGTSVGRGLQASS